MIRIVAWSVTTLILIGSVFSSAWVYRLSAVDQQIMTIVEPMPVLPTKVEAGKAVELMLTYQKPENIPGTVGLSLVAKGTVVPLTTFVTALPPTTPAEPVHRVAVYVQIPAYAPAGNYRLYLTKQYRPSIYRDDTLLWESESFDVINDHPLPLAFATTPFNPTPPGARKP